MPGPSGERRPLLFGLSRSSQWLQRNAGSSFVLTQGQHLFGRLNRGPEGHQESATPKCWSRQGVSRKHRFYSVFIFTRRGGSYINHGPRESSGLAAARTRARAWAQAQDCHRGRTNGSRLATGTVKSRGYKVLYKLIAVTKRQLLPLRRYKNG